jgi:hypothetical protein
MERDGCPGLGGLASVDARDISASGKGIPYFMPDLEVSLTGDQIPNNPIGPKQLQNPGGGGYSSVGSSCCHS